VELYLHTHTCPHVVCGTRFTLTTYSGFQIKEAGVGESDITTDEEYPFFIR
jgi:formylmethanofuran dehydrogenase subunit E